MDNNIEQIKAKLDIVELIRDYIPVKPAGANFKACCPFHNEKTASLIISPAKQIWHCFGCGKGGDVFKFIMEKEGLSFGEALRVLAHRAGVTLVASNPQAATEKQRLLDALAQATSRYHYLLNEAREAEAAREYLQQRGLTEEVISDWQIGYSSNAWDDLTKYLLSKGWRDKDLVGAGLAIKATGSNRIYDRFRGRIMFPIRDYNGNTVGFTARLIPGREGEDKMGKYINSPETAVFNKSKLLFGLDKAKSKIREASQVIIVEGQLDCITAHQFGFQNVVASSGTALTEDQALLLERLSDNIIFALDSDSAGQAATERAGEVFDRLDIKTVTGTDRWGHSKSYVDPARSFKKNIKVALMPNGKDPDECIRRDRASWIKAINDAKSLTQFYFDRIMGDLDLSLVENKKTVAGKLLPLIARLANPLDKAYWLRYLASKLDVDDKYLAEAIKSFGPRSDRPSETTDLKTKTTSNREELLSSQILALSLHFSKAMPDLLTQLRAEELHGLENQNLYKNLVIYYNQASSSQATALDDFVFNYGDFSLWLVNNQLSGSDYLDQLIILAERDFYHLDQSAVDQLITSIIKDLKRAYLNQRLKAVTRLIAELEADAEADNAELSSLLAEFKNLSHELAQFLD